MALRSLVLSASIALALALGSTPSLAIVYQVDRTIGSTTIQGWIETDGTIGNLIWQNFVDWNLVATQGATSATLLGPASGGIPWACSGNATVATATELTAVFEQPPAPSSFVVSQSACNVGDITWGIFHNPPEGGGVAIERFSGGGFAAQENQHARPVAIVYATAGATAVPDFVFPPLALRATPNPFNPVTTIRFDLAAPAMVTLRVLDAGGRLVDTLLDAAPRPAGRHSMEYRPSRASGVYYARIDAGGRSSVEKLGLLK